MSKIIIFNTYLSVILFVALYGCQTWSLALTEDSKLRLCMNRILRRIFTPESEEITGKCSTCDHRELHDIGHGR
jgi:hypothetical protein